MSFPKKCYFMNGSGSGYYQKEDFPDRLGSAFLKKEHFLHGSGSANQWKVHFLCLAEPEPCKKWTFYPIPVPRRFLG